MAIKCDCCGKFRKDSEIFGTGNEDENWNECFDCCSFVDNQRHFDHPTKDKE